MRRRRATRRRQTRELARLLAAIDAVGAEGRATARARPWRVALGSAWR